MISPSLVNRFSKYLRIARTSGWILRFVYNLCHVNRKIGEMTVDEFKSFPSHIKSLKSGESVAKKTGSIYVDGEI